MTRIRTLQLCLFVGLVSLAGFALPAAADPCAQVDGDLDIHVSPTGCVALGQSLVGAGIGIARQQCDWVFGNPLVPGDCVLHSVKVYFRSG